MLEQILDYIHNYFVKDVHSGTFVVVDGSLFGVDFLQNGQYYRIEGSVFNNGVHQYPDDTLIDEEFVGEIWAMAVPSAVIALTDEISNWNDKYGDVANGPFQSESWGGYSYTKSNGGSDRNGNTVQGWKSVFSSRLNHWRKIS